MRYKFAKSLTLTPVRPTVEGELPDVEVDPSIYSVVAGPPGFVTVTVAFRVPAYDPTTATGPLECHVVFPPSGTHYTDPELAIAAPCPKGSADASGHTAGGDLVVEVPNVPSSSTLAVGLTVIGYPDAPAPSSTTLGVSEPAVASDPSTTTTPPTS